LAIEGAVSRFARHSGSHHTPVRQPGGDYREHRRPRAGPPLPEPGLARTRLRLRPQAPNGPASIRATFVRAALAGFAGFAVLGLFTAVAPDFPCEELGEASRAVVGLVVFAVFAAPMAGQVALKLVLEGSPCPPDAWR
jgi:hypothetical protein